MEQKEQNRTEISEQGQSEEKLIETMATRTWVHWMGERTVFQAERALYAKGL